MPAGLFFKYFIQKTIHSEANRQTNIKLIPLICLKVFKILNKICTQQEVMKQIKTFFGISIKKMESKQFFLY